MKVRVAAMSTVLIVMIAIISMTKAVLTYLGWRQRQVWQTRRLEMALKGVSQAYRESVIRACGELENGGSSRRD